MVKEKFKVLEKLVTADVAYETYGKDLNELFSNSALALCSAMVEPKTVAVKVPIKWKMQNKDLNTLLVDFLNELVYYKDAESLFLPKVKVKVVEKDGLYRLAAEALGDKIDFHKHKLLADVKAATFHMFAMQKKGKAWIARFVLDI